MIDPGMLLVLGLLDAFDAGEPIDFAAARVSLAAAVDQQEALANDAGTESAARMLLWLRSLPPFVDVLEAGDRDGAVDAFNAALSAAFSEDLT